MLTVGNIRFSSATPPSETFVSTSRRPLIANMTEFGKSPPLTVRQLTEMGYRAVLFPVTLLRVAMKSVERALARLSAEGSQQGFLDAMQTRVELYDLLGYAGLEERDCAYLRS